MSSPNVKDTPRSFSPHPMMSRSGSDHSRSQSRPGAPKQQTCAKQNQKAAKRGSERPGSMFIVCRLPKVGKRLGILSFVHGLLEFWICAHPERTTKAAEANDPNLLDVVAAQIDTQRATLLINHRQKLCDSYTGQSQHNTHCQPRSSTWFSHHNGLTNRTQRDASVTARVPATSISVPPPPPPVPPKPTPVSPRALHLYRARRLASKPC